MPMYKRCGGATLAPLLGCVRFLNSDAQKETGTEGSWWERRQDADLFTGRKEGGNLFQVGEGVGRRKTGKNPLTSGHPETKYSGGKLGFSEAEVRPSEQTVYAGHTSWPPFFHWLQIPDLGLEQATSAIRWLLATSFLPIKMGWGRGGARTVSQATWKQICNGFFPPSPEFILRH